VNETLNTSANVGGILYNVTIKVDWSIHDAWLQWMKEEHIPEVLNTGCFINSKLLRIIETDEADGPTYAAQYFAENKLLYNRYIENYSSAMRQAGIEKWGNKFIAFRSVLQVVH
jgi:Domain of unknown function (DUF4286)